MGTERVNVWLSFQLVGSLLGLQLTICEFEKYSGRRKECEVTRNGNSFHNCSRGRVEQILSLGKSE